MVSAPGDITSPVVIILNQVLFLYFWYKISKFMFVSHRHNLESTGAMGAAGAAWVPRGALVFDPGKLGHRMECKLRGDLLSLPRLLGSNGLAGRFQNSRRKNQKS